jgi:Carboxypeptidase regulatory-like domain
MQRMRKGFWVGAVSAAVLLLLCPLFASANDVAAITGRVRDSGGIPVVGALVIVVPSSPILPERIALTDKDGGFSVVNLFAGQYTVKVSMPHFLSAMKQGVQLNSGGTVVLTVNLQSALDVVRRAVARDKSQSEDIVWTLRSSRSTQPVLRLADNGQKSNETKQTFGPDYSGYFQLYSKSVETSSGTTEGVGSQFSVTMPLDPQTKVNVHGQYNDSPMLPRGIGATYDFAPAKHHKAEVGLDVRQGALFADPLQTDPSREVQIRYGEDFQWSDHLVLNYGAEAGRVGTGTVTNYLRPRFGISWVPQSRTTLTATMSTQAPVQADDPIRGRDYFDRTLLVPPGLERYSHSELGLTRIVGDGLELTAAAFRDRTDIEALFMGMPDGRSSILILDTSNMPSEGIRLYANRKFKTFEAGIGYTAVNGIGIDSHATTLDDMKEQLYRRKFHVITAQFKAELPATQTEITTVYRWTNDFSVSRLDPYQRLTEYNDPTLSLSIAQNLPTFRMFPGRVQAILDARNLLDQAFGAPRTQVGQYPRLVKGGINIRF